MNDQMFTRLDVSFRADGDVVLRGWLYLPKGAPEARPAITNGRTK